MPDEVCVTSARILRRYSASAAVARGGLGDLDREGEGVRVMGTVGLRCCKDEEPPEGLGELDGATAVDDDDGGVAG